MSRFRSVWCFVALWLVGCGGDLQQAYEQARDDYRDEQAILSRLMEERRALDQEHQEGMAGLADSHAKAYALGAKDVVAQANAAIRKEEAYYSQEVARLDGEISAQREREGLAKQKMESAWKQVSQK